MDNAALKPGDRVAVWFYVTHATAHDVWLANKPGKPAIVDAPVSDIITAARRPDGWVMVPREPTHGMVVIGAVAGNTDDLSPTDDEIRTIYRAMLSAAPKKEPDHG